MDIISLPVEYDESSIDGRFRLVNMSAQRARELALGAEPRIRTKSRKVTTISIEEASENVLEYLTGEEAIRAKEEARKLDFRKLLEETTREVEAEELSELEKDLQIYMHERESEEPLEPSDEEFESEE